MVGSVSFVLCHNALAIKSLFKAIVAGIDDFDSVSDSLFSAFNMLVLGVFQIDTVRASGRFLNRLTISLLQFTKCGEHKAVSRVLFLFSMVFIPIVLLNLLIGITCFPFSTCLLSLIV
jgi:hypothetical protein